MPIQPGQYNVDYFSGGQVSLYIGDIWVDEITSMSYNVSQSKRPLYGYSDQLYRAVAEGRVLVQGAFTINFKEAGYLWLILDRYQKLNKQNPGILQPMQEKDRITRNNIEERSDIEAVINQEPANAEIRKIQDTLAALYTQKNIAAQTGFASSTGTAGAAEQIFEVFEDLVWGQDSNVDIDTIDHRRVDDSRLNPFDIYLTFGDYQDGNKQNHTVRHIVDVNLMGTSQQIVIDGQPIQEQYSFIARNIV